MRIDSTLPRTDPIAERAIAQHGDELGRATVGIRCHIYLRVSSPEQDADRGPDGRRIRRSVDDRNREVLRSLDTQEREARAYAERKGWTVVAVYRETFTGTDFWARPELRRLREAIADGQVDVMLCYKVDRFTREQTQLGVMINLLKQGGGQLDFVLDKVDDTPTGKFLLNALAFAAELELESIKERFSRGKLARLEAGRALHGPTPPYGCAWTDDGTRYRLPPRESVQWGVLRSAFLDVLATKSVNSIAASLTRRRIPAPAGGATWYGQSLKLLLTNPLYCGKPVSLRCKVEKRRVGHRLVERRVYTPEGAGPALLPPEGEPVVTPEEFAQAQEVMRLAGERQREHRGTRAPAAGDWLLLGGVARCGVCGGPLTAHSVKAKAIDPATGERRRLAQYACEANRFGRKACEHPVAISRTVLELQVGLRLQSLLAQAQDFEQILREYRAQGGTSEADRARAVADREAVRATLHDLEGEAKNLAASIARTTNDYARSVLEHQLEETGQQQARLVEDLRAAEAVLQTVDAELADMADFEYQAQHLASLLKRPEELRRLLPLAVRLFRPEVVVPLANPDDPTRPSLAKRPREAQVQFPIWIRRAVEALYHEVGATGDERARGQGLAASDNHRSWFPPLPHTPPAGPTGLWVAVAADGALSLLHPA